MYEITFQFENGAQEVKFSAAPGSTILEAAKSANVAIDAPCNGNGSCGKCRVKLVSGEVTGVQTGHISDEDYAAGWRLSCSTKPAAACRSAAGCMSPPPIITRATSTSATG